MISPMTDQESSRLAAVEEYEKLSRDERDALDDVANLASLICKVPISLVTFITEHEQLVRGAKGIDLESTKREVAFCANTIKSSSLFQVEDAFDDERFQHNPLVTGDPNIRFYAGFPLETSDGERLGALCVIDREPKKLTKDQVEALRILAEQVIKRLELGRTKRELQSNFDTLSNINALRTRLINVLAHDIRGPISSMRMVMDLLVDGDLSVEERVEFAQMMSDVLTQTDDLLQNILEWGKAIGFEELFNYSEVPVHDIIEDVCELTAGQAKMKKVKVKDTSDEALTVLLDVNVFRLVLRNLVANAVKYSKPNTMIEIRSFMENNALHLEVIDQGVGMTDEEMANMFAGGVQKSTKGTKGEVGTGLGLMFVKDMMSRYNGDIYVERNSSGGCTFVSIFPVP
ncbi:GAF domain-containing sensor histidine kinase [Phaeocystidibacter marisrubri]|uniref:histidine kinase n=1 Tax=Phaeocystidibacter marisrubri TaxID=1577780 RepID=A0A6L3ZH09_9FLAO|nr:GAF domain-containing sensor histidine kinase [Phaeocystidibacter marisrubri]KAB2816239.1 GAF domain-containing sensor histidine kinase [Phaeocystidibacter marisrubri]